MNNTKPPAISVRLSNTLAKAVQYQNGYFVPMNLIKGGQPNKKVIIECGVKVMRIHNFGIVSLKELCDFLEHYATEKQLKAWRNKWIAWMRKGKPSLFSDMRIIKKVMARFLV